MMNFLFAQIAPGSESYWLPVASSTMANRVDWLFYFILWLNVFFFFGILGMMLYFVMKYRRKSGVPVEDSPHHNTPLEVTWSVLPSFVVIFIFYEGFVGYLDMRTPPADAMEIKVGAKKWAWAFTYVSPDGQGAYVDNDLHVPVDTPVKLIMGSDDVLHSLYVPAFRVKHDVVPGRYGYLWFKATKPGDYNLFCTEYCGTKHSEMGARAVVHEAGGYERWLSAGIEKINNLPPRELGELLYKKRGCNQCHSIDGAAGTGPSFKGTFGTEQNLTDGSKITIDENYIRESILKPMAKVRGGFRPVMPAFEGQLKDKQVDGLVEYIKSLKN